MSRVSRTVLQLMVAGFAAAVLAGCPVSTGQKSGQASSNTQQPADQLDVVLVLTDLGIGDGNYARECDAALTDLAQAGLVNYTPVGSVPPELTVEGVNGDIGLPVVGGGPGSMAVDTAVALLSDLPDSDLLVFTSPLLLDAALAGVQDGGISTGAILVLDNDGYTQPEAEPPLPVYLVEYNVKDIAFLSGVAAAQSSNTSMLVAMAVATDPQAEDFLAAVTAGARFQSAGAQVATLTVAVDEELGYVTPELFIDALQQVREGTGPYFQSNHYILSLGRATPTIMLALTGEPDNAYTIGAYSDYRRVRPSRIVGCALKRPGVALEYILRTAGDLEGLAAHTDDGVIRVGLEQDAIGFTDFEFYERYNRDSADIEQAVQQIEALIRADELDYDY